MQDGRGKDCPDNKGLNEVWLDHCLIAICLPSTIIQVHSPRPVITTLHLHTQLHCRSLRGRSLLCRRGRKTHNQLFKNPIKLWLQITFANTQRVSSPLGLVVIRARFCGESDAYGNIYLRMPDWFPPQEPLRAAEAWAVNWFTWFDGHPGREGQRGTERILILTKLTHLGLHSGSRSLVPLCETVKNEQLFAHREGPYLTLFSPSCHLPWNENLSIKTEKSVLEIDAPVHPAAWSVAVCIKVRRWCLSLSSWKSRTQTTSFSERWLEGILGT